jgi:hypothetical protein
MIAATRNLTAGREKSFHVQTKEIATALRYDLGYEGKTAAVGMEELIRLFEVRLWPISGRGIINPKTKNPKAY